MNDHRKTSFSFRQNSIVPSPSQVFLKLPTPQLQNLNCSLENNEFFFEKSQKKYKFDGIFSDNESLMDNSSFRKNIQQNICKVLEGYNSCHLICENYNKNIQNLDFYPMVFVNLDLMRRFLQDLEKDNLNYLIKASFILIQKNVVKDFFEEFEDSQAKEKIGNFTPLAKYFIDCNELMNLMIYKLRNFDFDKLGELFNIKESFEICFKVDLFLYNETERVCWNGRLFLLDVCDNNIEKNDKFFSLLLKKKYDGNEESIDEMLIKEKENSYLNIYLKYNENVENRLEKDLTSINLIKNHNNTVLKNRYNNILDYITIILELQKVGYLKDCELYNKNMELFLKEKQLDECKLKIAQLESSLYSQNFQEEKQQNISIVEPNLQELDEDPEEKERNFMQERTSTLVGEENVPVIFRSFSEYVGKSLKNMENSKIYHSAKVLPKNPLKKMASEFFIGDNAYEKLLEINYYEELLTLRKKFQKINKELIQKSCENDKMMKLIEKLKEQHTLINNLENNKAKHNCDSQGNENKLLMEDLQKKDEEIKQLKKIIWEKEKTHENMCNGVLNYYIGDIDKMKGLIKIKLEELTLEKDIVEREVLKREIMKNLDFLWCNFCSKVKSTEELLKELNELYIYYCKKFHNISKKK